MPYEMDFIGTKVSQKDATSICMRWQNRNGSYTIGVFDGGFAAHGEAAKELLEEYYLDYGERYIDFVICSHPHEDHILGLSVILENFDVGALYMNRPWAHLNELLPLARAKDGRTTRDSLERRLRKNYKQMDELEKLAEKRGVPIYDALEGCVIENRLTVLSPSIDFYIQLLAEKKENMLEEDFLNEGNRSDSLVEKGLGFLRNVFDYIKESWFSEKLRENETTDPENETSTVILGEMGDESFLLTGDVGIRGLRCALDYASSRGVTLRDVVQVYEIPHHGGRHNVSPSILDELLGDVVAEGAHRDKTALVCTSNGSDHPRKMVVNAFIRRGVSVCSASDETVCHHKGDFNRPGWTSVTYLEFSENVEEWK